MQSYSLADNVNVALDYAFCKHVITWDAVLCCGKYKPGYIDLENNSILPAIVTGIVMPYSSYQYPQVHVRLICTYCIQMLMDIPAGDQDQGWPLYKVFGQFLDSFDSRVFLMSKGGPLTPA